MGRLYDERTSQLLSTQVSHEATCGHLTATTLSKTWREDEKGKTRKDDATESVEKL